MKELHTGANYWNTYTTGDTEWPTLHESLRTKVLIIGGGMSGLLTAFKLHEQNIECVLVEGKEISEGSSLASTGLLQYCSDLMLHELRKMIGRQKADLFYRSCFRAIDEVRRIASLLQQEVGDCQLQSRSSMQYCSDLKDIDKLQKEYEALSSLDLPCELWDQHIIVQHFPFSKRLALVTHQDAEINQHLFVIRLAQYLSQRGIKLFEHSKASSIRQHNNGAFSVLINDQYTIEAEYIIHAVGYHSEQLQLTELNVKSNRSYVVVTEPIADLNSWYNGMLLWETARPYLYARTTPDSRVIIGGLDETSSKLDRDKPSINRHIDKLLAKLNELFPSFHAAAYQSWNAYFYEPQDGLPYIGLDPSNSKHVYILGYGGNGTIYSMLGAMLAVPIVLGNANTAEHELLSMLSLSRLSR